METITQAEVGAFPISTNVFTVFSNDSALTPENKLTVLELLHESLDLKTMMNSFASITAKFVRPLNISFQSAHGFFSSKSD